MLDHATFHPEDVLLSRLRDAARKRRVVVLAGSALTMPVGDIPGVPTTAGIVDMIRDALGDDEHARQALDSALATANNPYQKAFEMLNAYRGTAVVNHVIRRAVLAARWPGAPQPPDAVLDDLHREHRVVCEELEADAEGWALSPGVEALGRLAARHKRFGQIILTTNFDPLVEIAITRAHGDWYRLDMGSDGSLGQAHGKGSRVVHLHGHWNGVLTLHTPAQLLQPRPQLEASLRRLLDRDGVLLVLAYSGWDDVLTRALAAVLHDLEATPEVLWTFYKDDVTCIRQESEPLIRKLGFGTGTSRVTLFRGIDVHRFLPSLADALLPTPLTDAPSPTRDAQPRAQSIDGGQPSFAPRPAPSPPPVRTAPAPVLREGEQQQSSNLSRSSDSTEPPRESDLSRQQDPTAGHRNTRTLHFGLGIGGIVGITLAAYAYFALTRQPNLPIVADAAPVDAPVPVPPPIDAAPPPDAVPSPQPNYAGTLLRKDTSAPIPRARLMLLGPSCQAYTSNEGKFEFTGCEDAWRVRMPRVAVTLPNHDKPCPSEIGLAQLPDFTIIRIGDDCSYEPDPASPTRPVKPRHSPEAQRIKASLCGPDCDGCYKVGGKPICLFCERKVGDFLNGDLFVAKPEHPGETVQSLVAANKIPGLVCSRMPRNENVSVTVSGEFGTGEDLSQVNNEWAHQIRYQLIVPGQVERPSPSNIWGGDGHTNAVMSVSARTDDIGEITAGVIWTECNVHVGKASPRRVEDCSLRFWSNFTVTIEAKEQKKRLNVQ